MRNANKISLFDAFLNELRILTSSDAPKGFDKYFKPPKSSESEVHEKKDDKKAEKSNEEPTKPPTKSPNSKPPPDWNFGMFGPTPGGPKSSGGSGQGQGRPIGGEQNPEQNKMLLYGAIGFMVAVGALTYFELGYKEISWKDFLNKYLSTKSFFFQELMITFYYFKLSESRSC